MEEKAEAQKDFLQQWVDMQEKLWKEWVSLGQEMLSVMPSEPGGKGTAQLNPSDLFKGYFDLMSLWSKAMPPSFAPQMPGMVPFFTQLYETWMKWWPGQEGLAGPGSWYEEFTKKLRKTFGEEIGDGLGGTLFKRITSSAGIYFDVLDFWAKTLGLSSEVAAGKPLSPEQVKELRDQWIRHYESIMEALWGAIPSPQIQDMVKVFSGTMRAGADSAWSFLEPLVKNLSQMPQILQKMAAGDTRATAELGGLFARNYEETMGKALLAPTLGYFRECQERINKAFYVYGKYATARTAFISFLYSTGMNAAEKVFERFAALNIQEPTPETLRELYRLWWSTNEEVYQEVFRSKEFIDLSRQMVEQGLLLRKDLDELSDQFLKFTNIPSKKDMDEIYHAIYEMRKELREQRGRIRDLEKQLAAQKANPNPGE
jgi:class III poly(R)-hydroxyalkanoic acid synthase PhaE subunit